MFEDVYGASSSPYLKASDHAGMNKAVTVKGATVDEITYQGKEPQKCIIIDVGADKPIKLSPTNARALGAHFTEDLGAWAGRKIILQTKDYDIEGKGVTGWINLPTPDDKQQD